MTTVDDSSAPTLISVMANAIGFEMFKHRGTDVDQEGHEFIDVSDEEVVRCKEAATRAYDQMMTYKEQAASPTYINGIPQ